MDLAQLDRELSGLCVSSLGFRLVFSGAFGEILAKRLVPDSDSLS